MSGDMITVETKEAEEEHESAGVTSDEPAAICPSAAEPKLPSVPALDGFLVRRVIDADNSCLFNSVGYVLQQRDRKAARKLRQVVVDAVSANQETFGEAFLGRANTEYCEWIKKEDSWGGAIEVSILSKHFGVEIVIVDISNTRIDRFGEDENYSDRVLIFYDGIHYDALALTPQEGSPEEFDKTVFSSVSDADILDAALKLAEMAKKKKLFTDTAKFQLRCLVCQQGLTGEKDALEHATSTGHQNFAEYS